MLDNTINNIKLIIQTVYLNENGQTGNKITEITPNIISTVNNGELSGLSDY